MGPHFVNLFWKSLDSFLSALGTTGLGWWVQGIIWFFATEIATYFVVWKLRGKDAMTARAMENFRIGFYAWLIVMACVYIPIFSWNVIKVIYSDHQYLVGDNRNLKASTSNLVDPKSRDDEITKLNNEIEGYKRTQRERESPVVRIFPVSHDIRPGVPKMEYVLTTGKIRTPAEVIVTCDFPIADADADFLTTTGGSILTLSTALISPTSFKISIESPAWSPSTPLWVTVFFEGAVNKMPSCKFSVE